MVLVLCDCLLPAAAVFEWAAVATGWSQAAYEIREAAERRHHQLSESLAAAEARAGELEEQNEALQRAAEGAQRQVWPGEAGLRKREGGAARHGEARQGRHWLWAKGQTAMRPLHLFSWLPQAAKLEKQLGDLQAEHAQLQEAHDKVRGCRACMPCRGRMRTCSQGQACN